MIAFGPFQFDPSTAELWRDGTRVHVPPQPAAALRALTARPGDLVTREELRQAIWSGVDHLDFNAGLNFCIGQLRGILGDRGSSPQYVVAVPKRGYRFIAEVHRVEPAPDTAPERPSAPARPARKTWAPWLAAAACVTVAVLSAGGAGARRDSLGTSDLLAAKAVVRASAGLADAGPDEIVRRIAMFDEAIARDSRFADAFAGKAQALLVAGHYRVRVPAAAYAEALVNAQRAVALAPRSARAHAAYGAALIYAVRDWQNARMQLRAAIALDDTLAIAHQWYSRYLSANGDDRSAIVEAERAVALTPSSASARTDLGLALFYAGRFADAGNACREAVGLLPAFTPARFCAGLAASEAAPNTDTFWRGRLERLEKAMAGGSCSCDEPLLAVPLAHLGETDRALALLERGADQTSDAVLYAAVHPAFAGLRSTPRFQFVLKRIGLPVS
jgi:DNA-binding winged helix-turn-helix (wHTH) protein/tetratricopeptide (TPR) repeat protein